MSKLIRKTWPKIRFPVQIRGAKYYVVDARKQGTDGKKEYFTNRRDAEERATEIARSLETEGKEGFSLNFRMRGIVLEAEARLQPFGKSLEDAVDFYIAYLQKQQEIEGSGKILDLTGKWFDDKRNNKKKPLRERSLKSIKDGMQILNQNFGQRRVAELTKDDFEKFFDRFEASNRRKYNLKSLFSQFYNWLEKKGIYKENPLADIEIVPESKDVEIYSLEQIQNIHRLLNLPDYNKILPYLSICLYAGLRPEEASLLDWKNVHLSERQITVLSTTSKTKETRNVHIEDKLSHLLEGWKGEKKGKVMGFYRKLFDKFKKDLGTWIPDGLRHTYASYWLAKYHDRAKLAELMGNSLKMIKTHYKQVVMASNVESFWN